MNLWPILIVFVLFFLGVPVAFAMMFASFVYFTFMCDGVNLFTMVSALLEQGSSFTMMAVPFFIMAGSVMSYGGVSSSLMDFCDMLTGRMKGGLGATNVLMSALMGGMSGSSCADAAFDARMLVPEMTKRGFSSTKLATTGGFLMAGNVTILIGVDEEKSLSMSRYKYNRETVSGHFILEDCKGAVDYNGGVQNVYALEGAAVLDKRTEERLGVDIGAFHVKLAVNTYGRGRAVYLAGYKHSAQNTRMLLRALLWAAGKEKDLCRAFSQNPDTECHYYPERGLYALVNNTGERAETVFFDTNGKESTISLQPYELKWIQA